MKALVQTAPLTLEYIDWPTPVPAPDEVLVRVAAVAICGSDVHGYTGTTGRRIPPIIMGHEASGVVESVGGKVPGWQPGTRVTFDSTVYCNECSECRRGRINLCERRQILGVSPPAFRRHGAMAEFVAVPHWILHRLPDGLSHADVVMEAVGIGQTVQLATDLAAPGGSLTLIGNVQPSIEQNLQAIVSKELTTRGSAASAGEYPTCLAFIAAGRLVVKPLISRVMPLADGQAAFDALRRGERSLLKIVLRPEAGAVSPEVANA